MVAAAATDARRDDGAEELAGSAVDGVPSPGRYIKEQRKRQGMSIDQLAAATKIPRTSLELLEADEHDALPGPVFVKGFLRCCARALGLEPEGVMELVYERERELLVARRRERPSVSEAPVEDDAPAPVPPQPNAQPKADPKVEPKTEPRPAGDDGWSLLGSLGSVLNLRRVLPRGGVSMMLWVAVALFVAMVMMAAFNMLGTTSVGPT